MVRVSHPQADDNTVKLWDVETSSEMRTFTGHTGLVRTVAFDHAGKRLVSGGYDTKIRVWDVDSGKQIATAHASSGAVFGVAFSPDGKRFSAGGTNESVQLFETLSGQEIMALFPGKSSVESVAFSPDGTRLAAAVAGKGTIRIWDAPHKYETAILSEHTDTVTSVTFSLDGSRIYSESENEKLVWNVATRETLPDAMWDPPEVITHTSPDRSMVCDHRIKQRRAGRSRVQECPRRKSKAKNESKLRSVLASKAGDRRHHSEELVRRSFPLCMADAKRSGSGVILRWPAIVF